MWRINSYFYPFASSENQLCKYAGCLCGTGSGVAEKWIISSNLHYLVWQTVEDGEGYVRAAVVNALSSLHTSDILWRDFTLKHVSQACHNITYIFTFRFI